MASRRKPTQLKLAILASGMTQREVAASLGWHEVTLSQYVHDTRTPPDDRKVALARVLGRTVEDLWPEPQELRRAA